MSPRLASIRNSALLLISSLVLGVACSKSAEEDISAPATDAPGEQALILPNEDSPQATGDEPAALPPGVPEGAMIKTDIEPGVRGGTIVIGIAGDPKTFNEPITDDAPSSAVASYLYDALYGFDNITQQNIPGLTESWEYNEEKREWTFHVRKNLKWSDGQPLTSDDFLFYTEIVRDPNVPSNTGPYLQTEGEPFEFSAPDPLTFVARIPTVDSFAFMSLGLLKAFPRHKYGKALEEGRFAEILGTDVDPDELVVSGPFKLKEFRSGERTVLEPNPHYHVYDTKGQRLPYVDELILLNVPDFEAMALRFQAGDLDIYDVSIQPQSLVPLQDGQEDGDYTVHSPGLALTNNHYWFNLKRGGSYDGEDGGRERWTPQSEGETPPADVLAKNYDPFVNPTKLAWFENEEFRKACSNATNREAMVRTILFGEGAPIYGFTVPSNVLWHNPDIARYKYDLDEARGRLDAIGFIDRDGDGIREDTDGNPIRFTLITNKENNVREKVGVLLKEDLTKVGLGVTLQLLDFNDIITRLHDTYDYEACLLGLASGVPPHPSMSRNIWLSSARMHTFNADQAYPNTPWEARIDELYLSLAQYFTYEEQKQITDQMEALWAEHQGVIHLFQPRLYVAASNKFGNMRPSVLRPHISHAVPELFIKPEYR